MTAYVDTIRFPIGDWSGDGHEKCEWFEVMSTLPVQEVREVHFSCAGRLGFDIGEICRKYGEYTIRDDIRDILIVEGIVHPSFFSELEENSPSPAELLEVWLNILAHLDSKFQYAVLPESSSPTINFYGFDDEGRHLNTPGYGLFQ